MPDTLHLHLSHSLSQSSLASPRSSTSSASNPSVPPLTPLLELGEKQVDEMVIASASSTSSDVDDDLRSETKDETDQEVTTTLKALSLSITPTPSLPIPESSPSSISSDGDVEGPTVGFSFGSCPSVPLRSTPTHELGPFDYPSTSSSTSSASYYSAPRSPPHDPGRRESFALGQTHRRNSVISRPYYDRKPSIPSPPATRRSSTCSTITTIPVAGRRPSIQHSASTNSGAAPPPIPPSPALYPYPSNPSSPIHSRRSSILFPQKAMPTPIPPSLLARRGSLPAAQLFGIPSSEMAARSRSSFAGQGVYSTTTAQLYRRRESIMSDGGVSSGSSSQTVTHASGPGDSSTSNTNANNSNYPTRRSSMRNSITLEPDLNSQRRSSMPYPPPGQTASPTRVSFPPSPVRNTASLPSATSPSQQYLLERRARHSSASTTRSGLSGPSLSSSEEEEEDEPLPTPGMSMFNDVSGDGRGVSNHMGFTDPWAKAGGSAETRSVAGLKATRPVLESIPSDETERAG